MFLFFMTEMLSIVESPLENAILISKCNYFSVVNIRFLE